MLLKNVVLARDFADIESAVAPVIQASQGWKNIHRDLSRSGFAYQCFAPTYGRWGGRFRYEARILTTEEAGRVSVMLELDRLNAREAARLFIAFAFFPLVLGFGSPGYLGLGIVAGVLAMGAHAGFLFWGAEKTAESFKTAYQGPS